MASLDQIDHFVVLMLENRSFDNLLGWLYPGRPDFEGLTGSEVNPDGLGGSVKVWSDPKSAADMWLPKPDPGELFVDINEQLFGDGPVSGTPSMNGFTTNYMKRGGNADDIMHCFSPEQVPAISALARSYAVCDHWYASTPCQTWPNRFFVHTGTAGGYENNAPPNFPYMMPTIFNVLNGHLPNGWEIYFHDFPQALTLTKLWNQLDRFRPFFEFLDDARFGHLPSYSFIEPRYFADVEWPSDMHPPHNVTYGDQLIASVYNAVRHSPNWNSTMLIVIFDEHGGCYDHVPPPIAMPPSVPRVGQPFAFDRYGVRIPAVVVSPLIKPGTVFRSTSEQPFDHASVIKTLRKRFGVTVPLTDRDATAPDLELVLNLDLPSNEDRELVQALASPSSDNEAALDRARLEPLNDFQQALHEAAAHLAPLIHGVTVENHIQSLITGIKPLVPQAANPSEAMPFIRNVLGKLLP
jgi:phospholipase C